MQSFIVVSKNKEKEEEYLQNFCKDQKIDRFDVVILKPEGLSIGIEEVRNFQKKLFLKSLKGEKAAIIKNSESLTLQAQNALLKVLEEPPPSTFIILTVSNPDLLLPTILSRCKIIKLKDKTPTLEKEIFQHLNILISLPTTGVGERLKLAESIGKTKEGAIVFLEKAIMAIRQELIKNVFRQKNNLISQYLHILISFNKTHAILFTTNANPRLTLENLFLDL